MRDSIRAAIHALNKHGVRVVTLLCVTIFTCSAHFLAALSQTRTNSQEERAPAANRPRRLNAQQSATQQPAFLAVIKKLGLKPESFCSPNDAVSRRVLEDYGAIYVASKSVKPPPVCEFKSDDDVLKFQQAASFTSAVIDEVKIELQPAAMQALLQAREEAQDEGLDITPRGGAESGRRSYTDTLRLWDSRFYPALVYWNSQGRLSDEQVSRLRSLPVRQQVEEALELEKSGIYFSADFSKSILYSVAAPGTSQHISMLAFDVEEYDDPRVREILTKHGWFQTIRGDLPHFTYLGLEEKSLPSKGLRSIMVGAQRFWIPDFGPR